MSTRIGLLLPRSTDYPAMGFDILDGLKLSLRRLGITDAEFITENIGFGEDPAHNHARTEKLLLQDDADMIVAYGGPVNMEPLMNLADTAGKPFLFLDAGMQLPEANPNPLCYYISLQGIHACRLSGRMAGDGTRKVLKATSFFDGGYRGSWAYVRGIEESGGSIIGNYVSGYKISEFTIEGYLGLLANPETEAVAASFSTYLSELFLQALKTAGPGAVKLPFYCAPFMAEEMILSKCDFPGGKFHVIVPWASSIENEAQQVFSETIQKEKKKNANIFHLLGWEGGIAAARIISENPQALKGWSFESPRGTVTFHPDTHITYAPLYEGKIESDENGKCILRIDSQIPVDALSHAQIISDRPATTSSGWKNNYFCS